MTGCIKNLYEILEVSPDASFDQIRKSYKRLARIYHPDINKNADADIKFKILNNAYDVLSDPIRRKNYDLLINIKTPKKEPVASSAPFKKEYKENSEFNFKPNYTKEPNADSVIKEVKISQNEALEGTNRTVNILNRQICPKCGGAKFINEAKCSFCLGEGEKKEHKKIEIKIKKGVRNGELIYVGTINENNTELFLRVVIEKSLNMNFEGNDIIVYVKIPLYDAILGVKKEIYIDPVGFINFDIHPLVKPNERIKLDIKKVNSNTNYYAEIQINFPEKISDEEKRLYDKIRRLNKKEGL